MVAVWSEMAGMLTWKREPRIEVKVFLGGKGVSAALATGFGKSLVKQSGATAAQHRRPTYI